MTSKTIIYIFPNYPQHMIYVHFFFCLHVCDALISLYTLHKAIYIHTIAEMTAFQKK